MRLHHYTPIVPRSYCVGVHNGHGFGSLFAKLFSKVAAKTVAKTAAKAVARVAKSAGKRALKEVTKQAPKLLKKAGKAVLEEGTKAAANFAQDKIQVWKKKGLNSTLPPAVTHFVADRAEEGLRKLKHTVPKTIGAIGDTLIHDYTKKLEKVAGIETKRNLKRKSNNKLKNPSQKRKRIHELQQLNKILEDTP